MKTKVSVVIPNYNGEKYIENCIESLINQSVKSFEIIIVDDCSTDDSMKMVMDKYPENDNYPRFKYIFHDENKGFCGSVNDGIRAAEAEFVILLNNDTVCDKHFVYSLYKTIAKDKRIFSVASRMVALTNPMIMDDCGDYYCILGWAFTPCKDKLSSNYNRKRNILAACGGAAIYRKSILQEIGMFDENHFAYLEDVDVGYRASLYGYKSIYEPKAIVKHAGSGTSGSRYNEFKAKLTARNNIYVIYKNMPGWQLVVNSPWYVAGTLIKLAFYMKKGLGKAYFEGIKEGLNMVFSGKMKNRRTDFERAGVLGCLKLELRLIAYTLMRFMG